MAFLTGSLIAAGIGAAGAVGGAAIAANGQKKAAQAGAQAASDANAVQLQMFNQQRSDAEPWRQIGTQALDRMGSYYGFAPTSQAGAQQAPQNPAQPAPSGIGGAIGNVLGQLPTHNGQPLGGAPMAQTQVQPGSDQRQPMGAGQPGSPMDWLRAQPGYQFRMDEAVRGQNAMLAAQGRRLSGGTLAALDRTRQGVASNEFGNEWNRLAGLAGVGQSANQSNNALAMNYAGNVGSNTMQAGAQRASAYANNGQTWGNALGGLGGTLGSVFNRPQYQAPGMDTGSQIGYQYRNLL
jgi:hypothetical protein